MSINGSGDDKNWQTVHINLSCKHEPAVPGLWFVDVTLYYPETRYRQVFVYNTENLRVGDNEP